MDAFWGEGADGNGLNILGHMLMNIRCMRLSLMYGLTYIVLMRFRSMLTEHVFDSSNPLY